MGQVAINEYVVADAKLSSNGLRVCSKICPPPPDRVSYPSVPEHCIILHVANPNNLERHLERRLDDGKWHSGSIYPGVLTFVPAQRESVWL